MGKDGDIVVWSGHPFSPFSHVETTLIEGDVYFDRAKDAEKRTDLAKEREDSKSLMSIARRPQAAPPRIPTERRRADRDSDDYINLDGGTR